MSDNSSSSANSSPKMGSKRRVVKCFDSDDNSQSDIETKTNKSDTENAEEPSESTTDLKSIRIKERRSEMTDKFKKRFSKSKKKNKAHDNEKTVKINPSIPKSQIPNLSDSDSEYKSDNKLEDNEDHPKLFKSTIPNLYDSESSDDADAKRSDSEDDKVKSMPPKSSGPSHHPTALKKKSKGGIKLIEAKPQRMSAKQAMENMQKIKSESGRMMREKEVSLPYHRPKQISLKDILAKKKINLTTGSQRMGIRMNESQLRDYAKELEEREKQMIELCKSESEEEEVNEKEEIIESKDVKNNSTIISSDVSEQENKQVTSNAIRNLSDAFQKEEESDVALNNTNQSTEKNNSVLAEEVAAEASNTANPSEPAEIEAINMDDTDNANDNNFENNLDSNKDIPTNIDLDENGMLKEPDDAEMLDVFQEKNAEDSPTEMTDLLEGESQLDSKALLCEQLRMKYLPSKSQPSENSRQKILSQMLQSSLPDIKPTLTGSPGHLIDLISGDVKPSGVELLKQKYLMHAAMKTPGERERDKERRIKPGAALFELKKILQDQISDQRTQEWTKRLEQEALKKQEEKGELSDCEEFLEKDEKDHVSNADNDDASEEGEEEEEEEEETEIKEEKRKNKCGFIDEEAEDEDEPDGGNEPDDDSDDEESSDDSDDELATDPQEKKKNLTRIVKAFNDSDSSDDEATPKTSLKKPTTNIIPTNIEENVTSQDNVFPDAMNTPMKNTNTLTRSGTSDLFDSQSVGKNSESFSNEWEDELPLGQKFLAPDTPVSLAKSISMNSDHDLSSMHGHGGGRSDLAGLVSPLIKPNALQQIDSTSNTSIDQSPNSAILTSPCTKKSSPYAAEKYSNLQKKLFMDSQPTQDSEELANLCSGEFPSLPDNSVCLLENRNKSLLFDKKDSTQMTQNTEDELLGLCTGKFVGINDKNQQQNTTVEDLESQNITLTWSESMNTENIPNINELIARSTETDSGITKSIIIDNKSHNTSTLSEIPPTSESPLKTNDIIKTASPKPTDKSIIINGVKNQPKTIKSFFTRGPIVKDTTAAVNVETEVAPKIVASNQYGKFIIMSSDDEAAEEASGTDTKKLVKSKKERKKLKKKRQQLQISDESDLSDEEDYEESAPVIDNDDNNVMDSERLVEYDSEENEVEIQPEQPLKKKKKTTSEFFDQEAELTSEDEWQGSGDEDERGLDQLEWEAGDADQLDHGAVKKQLERIHLREILDQDKQEVRILQEMLLEDGDLEGGTRERKFKWRNVDTSIESGAVVADDELDGGNAEEELSEEQWRKQRHERESFLRQMEKENNTSTSSHFSQEYESSLLISSKKSSLESSSHLGEASKINNAPIHNEPTDCSEKVENLKRKNAIKDLPSPVKKPFSLMQNNVRGSFLSRGQAAMARLALLAKNGAPAKGGDTPTNLSSLAPGKKRNFVFATVSPPCQDTALSEETKLAKRKATSELSTPILIKKIRVNENSVSKSRKSLMDHLE